MIEARRGAVGWGALALAAALACGGDAGRSGADPADRTIARIGERPVTWRRFDAWLASTLGGAAEVASAGPELKSRLLDQYLDEELLVAAAGEQGLTVTDEETARIAPADPNAGRDPEAARRVLLQRKFKEQVILKGMTVTPEEVRTYFEAHVEQYRRPARVVLRQILLDTETEARRVRAELAAHPERFEEIAETRSLAPDGGRATPLEESILPEAIRAALVSLKPGELSDVVADPQGFFILVMEQRQPEQAPSLETAREEIELKLLQERSQHRYEEYLATLRMRVKVTIDEEALGFPYVKKGS